MFSDKILEKGSRVACWVQYHGGAYLGWQLQSGQKNSTIQGLVENAVSVVADSRVRIYCAGRTDARVHALGQVFHFDDPAGRSLKAWVHGVNGHLPKDIRILWAQTVPEHFHSRFSALSRSYRYMIVNTSISPALLYGLASWHRKPLDEKLMNREVQCLLGEHDFNAFRASTCQSPTSMRNIISIEITRHSDLVFMDVKANAFLHHMVRNIVGCVIAIGDGRKEAGWLKSILLDKDRSKAAETAAADGLYLMNVEYPEEFSIPRTSDIFPLTIQNK